MSEREDQVDGSTSSRSTLWLWGGSLLATVLLFVVALKLMGPAPPKTLVFAAGPADGAYVRFAEAYRDVLAEDGIEVEVVETAGSVDNLARLDAGTADLAFVQGSTATALQREHLGSVASVFLEPLWVFARREHDVTGLAGLQGLRLAVGPEGSGTRALALRLLATLTAGAPAGTHAESDLAPLGGSAAAGALLAGDVDAAFFVVAPEAPYLADLLASPAVRLVSMPRYPALIRRYRFLADVFLPRGVLDLARDVPRQDLHVLAPTAAIVAGPDLHGAVAALLIEAARRVHGEGSLLAEPGRFPSPHGVDVPLSEDAQRYFDHGPSWIYRAFPFSLASFLDRAIFLLLPLVTLLFPLLKTAPPLYRWGIRRRIYTWYRGVRDADRSIREGAPREVLERELADMERIEREVGGVSIPLSYMAEFYDLRIHLDFVTRRLREQLSASNPSA